MDAFAKLLENSILAFVIIALRYMDIQEKIQLTKERDINAKEKAEADRTTQIIVGKAYADAINNLAAVVTDTKMTVIEQYKNIGITQDLIDIAKVNFQDKKRER